VPPLTEGSQRPIHYHSLFPSWKLQPPLQLLHSQKKLGSRKLIPGDGQSVYRQIYRARQKLNPYEKFYISGIVAVFITFARLTDEDSFHILCIFY